MNGILALAPPPNLITPNVFDHLIIPMISYPLNIFDVWNIHVHVFAYGLQNLKRKINSTELSNQINVS